MPQYQRIQGIKSSLGGVFVQGLLYLGTYLKRPIFLKCENISPPGTYSSIMYRLELSCNDMYCLVSCLLLMGQYCDRFSSYAAIYAFLECFLTSLSCFIDNGFGPEKYNGHGLYMIQDKIRMQGTLIPGILS